MAALSHRVAEYRRAQALYSNAMACDATCADVIDAICIPTKLLRVACNVLASAVKIMSAHLYTAAPSSLPKFY